MRDPDCDNEIDGNSWWECQPEEYRNSHVNILGVFSFGISSQSKSYCTKLSELYEVDWSVWDEETQGPSLTPYTLTEAGLQYLGDSESWDTDEKCFSIDKDDAIRNIWDYGVYNADGSKFKLDNQSFPIRTEVTVDERQKGCMVMQVIGEFILIMSTYRI